MLAPAREPSSPPAAVDTRCIPAPPACASPPAKLLIPNPLRDGPCPAACPPARPPSAPSVPPLLRTNRTRRVRHPVLIGHAVSFTPY